eukprot:1137658-Pelagomonas_calceolata.AAC.5
MQDAVKHTLLIRHPHPFPSLKLQHSCKRAGTSVPCGPSLAPEVLAFPLCCGPKYLVRYLRDMGALTLIIWDMASRQQAGQCVLPLHLIKVSNCACMGTNYALQDEEAAGHSRDARGPGGALEVDVRFLDVGCPVVGAFPVTSTVRVAAVPVHCLVGAVPVTPNLRIAAILCNRPLVLFLSHQKHVLCSFPCASKDA